MCFTGLVSRTNSRLERNRIIPNTNFWTCWAGRYRADALPVIIHPTSSLHWIQNSNILPLEYCLGTKRLEQLSDLQGLSALREAAICAIINVNERYHVENINLLPSVVNICKRLFSVGLYLQRPLIANFKPHCSLYCKQWPLTVCRINVNYLHREW